MRIPLFCEPWRLLLPLLCAALLVSCSHEKKKETETPAPVQVSPVRTATLHRIVDADAVLYPLEQRNVMPKVSAPVRTFYANRGDHVKAGQLLAVLENRDLIATAAANQSQVAQAEANLRTTADVTVPESVVKAESDVQAALQQLDAAQKLVESRRELFRQGAIARKLVDEANVQYANAKAQLDTDKEHLRVLQQVGKGEQIKNAQAQVQSAKAQYRSAEAQVAYTEIRAGISGVVADRPLYAGDMAATGTPLFVIMNISRIVARANVPQAQVTSMKVGDPATISETDRSYEIPGKVTVISPATDTNSTTVQVWVEAVNRGERLKPGASVHVAIVTGTIPNSVVVPAAAILPGDEGGNVVDVITPDNIAHQRKVDLGVREGGEVQILRGASPAEQVVVVGGMGLDDNAKVRIVKPAEEDKGAEK